jgi:hypothetical protein
MPRRARGVFTIAARLATPGVASVASPVLQRGSPGHVPRLLAERGKAEAALRQLQFAAVVPLAQISESLDRLGVQVLAGDDRVIFGRPLLCDELRQRPVDGRIVAGEKQGE